MGGGYRVEATDDDDGAGEPIIDLINCPTPNATLQHGVISS